MEIHMTYRIVLIEDDPQICEILTDYLTAQTDNAFVVDCANDGEKGFERIVAGQYDLVLLDIMLPHMDGFALCREMRRFSDAPVIFITARGREEDKLRGYHLGCDDYLVKPFEVVELVARVEVVLRRYHIAEKALTAGDIVVDMEAHKVTRAGNPVALTNKEYGLLVLFIQNKNVALFKERLYEKVWGDEYLSDSRTLELHVQRLRKKLGWENSLVAVYKVGYRLEID